MSDSKIISVQSDMKRKQIVIRYQVNGVKDVIRFGFDEKQRLAEWKIKFAADARAALSETEEPG